MLGAREHQHLVPVVAADQVRQQLALAVAVDRVDALGDDLDRRVARRDLDHRRRVQQAVGEVFDLVGEGRREQQVLPLLRQQREDPLDVADEAHVEHPVGLVEDQDLDPRQVERALALVVEQPARRGDQHFDAAAQLRDLRVDADTAVDHHRRDAQVLAVHAHTLLDLRGEFARGRENQRADRLLAGGGARHGRSAGRKALQHGQHEAGGLAGAGLGAGKQVAAREHGGDRLLLDRRGFGVALFGDRTNERVGKAERGKRHEDLRGNGSACRRIRAPVAGISGVERGVGFDSGRGTGQVAA